MIKTYARLTKPGIIAGNLVTTVGGFFLASKGHVDFFLLCMTLTGLGLIIAAGCVWNNYIDRFLDGKMERTKHRPLAQGDVSLQSAQVFASSLAALGTLLLSLFLPWGAVFAALAGLFIYVIPYSLSKSSKSYATLVGSIAGAVPIVVGYTAVSSWDIGAFLLLMSMVLWQMPHFFAIALYRIKDYAAAGVPVLPLVKGVKATQVQMFLYTFGFLALTPFFTWMGYTGGCYLLLMGIVSLAWVILAFQGFKAADPAVWAKKMFFFSLVIIMVQAALLSIDFVGKS